MIFMNTLLIITEIQYYTIYALQVIYYIYNFYPTCMRVKHNDHNLFEYRYVQKSYENLKSFEK